MEVESGGLLVEDDGAIVSVSSTSVDPLAVTATSECMRHNDSHTQEKAVRYLSLGRAWV